MQYLLATPVGSIYTREGHLGMWQNGFEESKAWVGLIVIVGDEERTGEVRVGAFPLADRLLFAAAVFAHL